jgi:hypothetical protein
VTVQGAQRGPRLRLHYAVEQRVLDHDPGSNGERRVSARDARLLIASGRYRASTGAPYGAIHYRRSLDDGSCLHLVVEGHRRRLHHDSFDPHRNLLSLGMHVTHEAQSEAVSCLALAWGMIRLLAR